MSITVKSPGGEESSVAAAATAFDAFRSAGIKLKDVIAAKVDGKVVCLHLALPADAAVEPVLADSADGLEVLRHSSAHMMAQAVKRLFPDTQVTIGPVIEDGFYYDFKKETPFTP